MSLLKIKENQFILIFSLKNFGILYIKLKKIINKKIDYKFNKLRFKNRKILNRIKSWITF